MGAIPRTKPVALDDYFGLPAESKRPLKLLLLGESGTGKTYTSLVLARKFGRPWAALVTAEDAERFDDYRQCKALPENGWLSWVKVRRLSGRYPTSAFVEAIEKAAVLGFVGLLIDQIGCNWGRPGGILEAVTLLDQESNKAMNGWTALNGGNAQFNALSQAIACCPIHLIVTCRSRTKFKPVGKDERGKLIIERHENEICHRDGAESLRFAFDQIFLMDHDHTGVFLKPEGKAFPKFNGAFLEPGVEVASLLKEVVRA